MPQQPQFTPEEHDQLEAAFPQLQALAKPSVRAGAGPAAAAGLPSWLSSILPLLEKLLSAYLASQTQGPAPSAGAAKKSR